MPRHAIEGICFLQNDSSTASLGLPAESSIDRLQFKAILIPHSCEKVSTAQDHLGGDSCIEVWKKYPKKSLPLNANVSIPMLANFVHPD